MTTAELSFYRFCHAYPNDGTDLADLCSEIRIDRDAPTDDAELRDHLRSLFVHDPELVAKLWSAYRRQLRRTGTRAPLRGSKR